jgi:hypothetical protein
MNNAYTNSFGMNEPITIERIREALTVLSELPENKEWIIVSPDGQMYKGEFDKVFPVFMRHHPLLSLPLGMGTLEINPT